MPAISAAIPIIPLPQRSSVLFPLRASAHRCCFLFAQALIGAVSSSRKRSSVPNWLRVLHLSPTPGGYCQRIVRVDGGGHAGGRLEQPHALKPWAALERVLHRMRRADRVDHVRAADRLIVNENRAARLTDR